MIDLHEKDRWIPLGTSKAWCWQQGCMLQWIPGTASKVIWNDREKDRFVSHILDVATGDKRTLPSPIYALSPNGKEAVSCDFARVADCRPGYGYAGVRDPFFGDMAPAGSGITHVNLETGAAKLIITHRQLAALGEVIENRPDSKHHAYHLLCGPDGKRFILLHRWTQPQNRQLSRLITAAMDGSDLRIVIPNGFVSHFIWRDSTHILSQAKGWLGHEGWGNFLFEDKTAGIVEQVGRGEGMVRSGGEAVHVLPRSPRDGRDRCGDDRLAGFPSHDSPRSRGEGFRLLKLVPSIQSFLAGLRDPKAIRFFSLRRMMPLAKLEEAEQRRAFAQMREEFDGWAAPSIPACSVAMRPSPAPTNRMRIG